MSFEQVATDDCGSYSAEGVYSFPEVNDFVWHLPRTENGEPDFDAVMQGLEKAPEESSSLVSRGFLNWMNPYVYLARDEELNESSMPQPRRTHRAVYCGAQLSRAFREEEVRRGRDAWRMRVEAAEIDEDGAVRIASVNPLAGVQFRTEANVRGRLRWIGYLRSCDTPHVLLGGVEWDEEDALPRYRHQHLAAGGEAVHNGFVHGERLFHQAGIGGMCCTCEYLHDLVPLSPASEENGYVATPAPGPTPRAPSLLVALFGTFRGDLITLLGPSAVAMACDIMTPYLLQQFVRFLQSNREKQGIRRGLLMFCAFAAVIFIKPLANNKQLHRSRRVSSLFRSATLSVIFEKCFTVSPDALAQPEMGIGRVLTMASADIENIKEFPIQVVFLWVAPIMMTMYLVYLFLLMGWSAVSGVAVFFLLVPLQIPITRSIAGRQQKLAAFTDQRMRRTNEFLSSIRMAKTMGWESKFLAAVEDDSRDAELRERRGVHMCYCGMWVFLFSAAPLMVAAMFATYSFFGHVLDASIVLPVITIIGGLTYPIMMLPIALPAMAKFVVSTARITQFLECDDSHITVEHSGKILAENGSSRAGACLDKATVLASAPTALPAYEPRHRGLRRAADRMLSALLRRQVPIELQWRHVTDPTSVTTTPRECAAPASSCASDSEHDETDGDGTLYAMEDKALLRDVCVSFPRGKLTIVVGATGSGKTVLLSTLLGTFRFRGRVGVLPSIAYVPQQPWIMQETVESNITFFEDGKRGARVVDDDSFEENDRLRNAVQRCQLEADLSLLSQGLATEIGEKGTNLSGGQKARVSLARAVYANCDVYVLDDPLSALDAHVGRRVMEEVVLRALHNKTRVLATHQLHVLPHADQVVVVCEGGVVFAGTYKAYAESEWKAHVENEEDVAEAQRAQQIVEPEDTAEADEFNECSPLAPHLNGFPSNFPSNILPDHGQHRSQSVGRTLSRRASHHALLGLSVRSRHRMNSGILSRHGSELAYTIPAAEDEFNQEVEGTLEARQLRRRRGRSGDGYGNDSFAGMGARENMKESASGDAKQRGNAGRSGEADGQVATSSGGLIIAEEKEAGHIPWRVYKDYFEAGGGMGLAFLIAGLYFLTEALVTGTSLWLTLWSVQYFAGKLTTNQELAVYLILTICLQVLKGCTDLLLFSFSRRASRRLHATLLYTISSATLTFFDRTPLGRVINRFSKDIYTLDDELTAPLSALLQTVGLAITSLAVTMYTSPFTIFAVLLAGYLFVRLLKFYTAVVREVRRRGSVVQSPLFSLLEEVLQGRETIMAYGKSHALFAEALRRLDLVYSCTYMERAVTVWLSIRMKYIASVVIVLVGLIGIVEKVLRSSPEMADTRVGLISLSVTMCLDLSWQLSSLISLAAVVEASVSSVQRICHYIDNVPQEALLLEPSDPHVKAALVSHGGAFVPTTDDANGALFAKPVVRGDCHFGAMKFAHVNMQYRPGLPLVLRDVSFSIAPGQKVGVVGRTGSGKSTLMLAFLRLVEVCGGRMLVCGRDAQSYTLPALRRLFSMIPQDPVLFDGTIRSNVDPFSSCSDAEVRRALASVGFVETGGDGCEGNVPPLETVVQEGGSNFSVGQRQLLCLARALLKKGSAFILMDEATANVDARLDQTVQRVVAEQFRDYTVVTIAHRLHTVAAYDLILVMAHGRLVEMGSPRSLLYDRGSTFYGMVAQSAAETAAGVSDGVSANPMERQKRVEEAVANFLKDCK